MSEPRDSLLRSVFDRVDRIATQSANSVVRTDLLADVVSASTRLEARLRRRAERQATWVWHLWHLPSESDVRRISGQLAALEARLRDVSERLDERDGEASEARPE
jgi:hypothetical protein